jgi:hypothetical protein
MCSSRILQETGLYLCMEDIIIYDGVNEKQASYGLVGKSQRNIPSFSLSGIEWDGGTFTKIKKESFPVNRVRKTLQSDLNSFERTYTELMMSPSGYQVCKLVGRYKGQYEQSRNILNS